MNLFAKRAYQHSATDFPVPICHGESPGEHHIEDAGDVQPFAPGATPRLMPRGRYE